MPVRIDAATAEDADAVVEMWVSLAASQRSHGSHLAAEDNRKQIRDAVARHIVLDGLRVARLDGDSEREAGDESGSDDSESSSDDSESGSDDSESSSDDSESSSDGDESDSLSHPSADHKPELDRDTIGFVMFALETGTYVQDVSRGVVRNLYVRPEYRGDGVGRALLTAAESALHDAGADVATLEAMADNERARSFYGDHDYESHRIEFEKPLGETDQNDTHTRED